MSSTHHQKPEKEWKLVIEKGNFGMMIKGCPAASHSLILCDPHVQSTPPLSPPLPKTSGSNNMDLINGEHEGWVALWKSLSPIPQPPPPVPVGWKQIRFVGQETSCAHQEWSETSYQTKHFSQTKSSGSCGPFPKIGKILPLTLRCSSEILADGSPWQIPEEKD